VERAAGRTAVRPYAPRPQRGRRAGGEGETTGTLPATMATHDALIADGSPLLDTRAVPISDWTLVWDGSRIPVRLPVRVPSDARSGDARVAALWRREL